MRVWQVWHGIEEMTYKELDCYIARFVQEAVKRDGKGLTVATALLTKALNCIFSCACAHTFPYMYV